MNKFKAIVAIGILFVIAGVFALSSGLVVNDMVVSKLVAQQITTSDDASIPNVLINSIETAISQADIIQHHADGRSDGLRYAELGRFAVPDGNPAGTSDKDEALLDDSGNPVPNSARSGQLTASGLITSLSLSAMAIGMSYLIMGIGLAFAVIGGVFIYLGQHLDKKQ